MSLALIALAATVAAQGVVWPVNVAPGAFIFDPPNTPAAEGDIVSFIFTGAPGNHSVSQASFSSPCVQMASGFDSGFVFVPAGNTVPPVWNLTITNASTPLYFYCKQTAGPVGPHCLAGMVGAINAPANGTAGGVDSFMKAAMALKTLPSQTAGSLVGVGASATASPSPLATAAPGSSTGTASAAATTAGSTSGTDSASAGAPSSTPAGAAFRQTQISLVATVMALALGAAVVLA